MNTYEDESEEEAGHKDPKEGEHRDNWGKSGILAGKTVKPRWLGAELGQDASIDASERGRDVL